MLFGAYCDAYRHVRDFFQALIRDPREGHSIGVSFGAYFCHAAKFVSGDSASNVKHECRDEFRVHRRDFFVGWRESQCSEVSDPDALWIAQATTSTSTPRVGMPTILPTKMCPASCGIPWSTAGPSDFSVTDRINSQMSRSTTRVVFSAPLWRMKSECTMSRW
jgi:hypothetical protein